MCVLTSAYADSVHPSPKRAGLVHPGTVIWAQRSDLVIAQATFV